MEVEVKNLDYYGRGITKVADKVTFIDYALPKEVVDINIYKESKKYNEAVINKIIKKSSIRNSPKCEYFTKCGGCNLDHISLEEENQFKLNKLKELEFKFLKTDNLVSNDFIAKEKYNYRNKIVLRVKDNVLGLYEKNSNNIIGINKCILANEKINQIIMLLKTMELNDNEITIRISSSSNMSMVIFKEDISGIDRLKELVDIIIIGKRVITNTDKILANINDIKYLISPFSFFQINDEITKIIYDDIKKIIKSYNSKKVLDLYCGSGTIGLYIADIVDEVIGIEQVDSSIEDAILNKELNNIKNINFIKGKVENNLDELSDFDTVIVDPPRAGLDKKTIQELLRINPNTIVYMSCDPYTLFRDLVILKDNYTIKEIKGYNMFPNTHHVESLVTLCRK